MNNEEVPITQAELQSPQSKVPIKKNKKRA